ncbi:hypothetical protein ACFPGO_08300 [Arcanobacterium canis]|uniref:Peptide zinc metalloprotease protein n=1 Tax=Arcanobacterium canis TaxID=999183 RepID=A0ABY8FXJ7_9ACTO|nr:hypothetical protein [Arcanobacterium canis]WFM83241.1 hypothetical protein P7079_07580 [Arcanobacterium canis]
MTSQNLDLIIRPGVILGPAIARDGVPVHAVYNVEEDRYYQIGEREFFIIDKLKRGLELDQISRLYTDRFGKVLSAKSWHQMAILLRSKRLLLEDGIEHDPQVQKRMLSRNWRLFSGKVGLFDPSPLIANIQRKCPWVVSKGALLLGLLGFAALCMVVGFNFKTMQGDTVRVFTEVPSIAALIIVILLFSMFVHEMGHALACVGAGGACHEIGFAWRIPMFYFYATTDDVYLAPANRRVVVSTAGMLAGSLPLVPFVVAYLFLGEGFGAGVVASILYVGFFATAINLVPLFGLDGHKILSHSLGVWDISSEGRNWILNVVSRKSPCKHFGFGVRVFAIFELLAMTAMVVGSTWWWIAFLALKVGVMWAILIVILMWLIAGLILMFFVQRNRKKKL